MMATPATLAAEMVTLTEWTVDIPYSLCGMELSKNGRAHWSTRHRAFQDQKDYVYAIYLSEHGWARRIKPWPAATMHIEWRYSRGRAPDDDNAISRVSACRDAFQAIGLVADDKHIRQGQVQFTKVPTGQECVVVTLRRDAAPKGEG